MEKACSPSATLLMFNLLHQLGLHGMAHPALQGHSATAASSDDQTFSSSQSALKPTPTTKARSAFTRPQ